MVGTLFSFYKLWNVGRVPFPIGSTVEESR